MSKDCVICRGAETIRLPVHRHAIADYSAYVPTIVDNDVCRTYACPECQEKRAAEEKIVIVYSRDTIRGFFADDLDAIEGAKRNLATITGMYLLEHGFLKFRQEKRGDDIEIRSRLGVVSPAAVTTIERRAIDQMKEFLRGALGKAIDAISVWGSAYSGNEGPIRKSDAIRFTREAFDKHIIEVEERLK